MREEEWRRLYENYETTWLLGAVGHVDELRGHLGDGEHLEPPEIRTDLLKLHELAMDVVNNGWDSRLHELAELAVDLETQTVEMMESLEAIHQALSRLTELLPDEAFEPDEWSEDI